MSVFLLPAHGRSPWRYLLQLKYSPAPPVALDQLNTASPLPSTPPSFFSSKPSHLGTRLLHTQCPFLIQNPSVVRPFDVNRLVAPLGFACRLGPLFIRLTSACVPPRLISYEFVATRSFSSSGAANLVIGSTEECSQEVGDAAPIEQPSVPEESDGPTTLGVVEVVADDSQTSSSTDDSLHDESNVAELRKLKVGSNESPISQMKDTEEFGLSVNRLEKMIEVQRHSLDQVRAQLENQKEIISSILKDVSFLKSQSEKRIKGEVTLKSLSTDERRLEKIESGEIGASERVSRRADVSGKFQPPFWPEWTSFLEHLKSLDLFQPDSQTLPEDCGILEDPALIRRAFSMFSRSHGPVFELLSRKDLQVLAQYGGQSDDKRSVASEQRLRNYFQIEETSTSGERSQEKSTILPPNLSDVMRLIYMAAERAFSHKAALPDDMKSSVIHLLQELSRLNVDNDHSNMRSESTVNSSMQVKKKVLISGRMGDSKEEDQQKQLRRTKVGKDQKEEGAKISAKIETDARAGAATSRSTEWKCPRCSFMNLQHKNRCVECSLKQPQKAHCKSNLDEEMNEKGSAMSLLDEDMKLEKISMTAGSKGHTDEKRAQRRKENVEQVTDSSGQSTQEEDSRDGHRSSSLSKDEDDLDSDEDIDSSDLDEDFDILDDLDPEDYADVKKSGIMKGVPKRSSLSDLVDGDMDDFSTRKRRDQGDNIRRNDFGRGNDRSARGKRYGDEQGFKSKRAPKEDDDDEDLSDDEESPRRSSKGRSDFRERGAQRYGAARGGRGLRGDSYDNNSSRRTGRSSSGSGSYDRSYSGDGEREYRSTRGGGRGFGGRGRGRGRSRY